MTIEPMTDEEALKQSRRMKAIIGIVVGCVPIAWTAWRFAASVNQGVDAGFLFGAIFAGLPFLIGLSLVISGVRKFRRNR